MSNFQCHYCGVTHIDCGKEGFKTPREIALEGVIKKIEEYFDNKDLSRTSLYNIHCIQQDIQSIIDSAKDGETNV